jgi:hypothetical protein
MSIEAHNKLRDTRWPERFTKDKSKIFLIVGKKENGDYTFATDISPNPFQVAQELEAISKSIKKKYL